jgi:hypothetical protein
VSTGHELCLYYRSPKIDLNDRFNSVSKPLCIHLAIQVSGSVFI